VLSQITKYKLSLTNINEKLLIIKKEISEEKEIFDNVTKIMILNKKLINNTKKIDNLSYKHCLSSKLYSFSY
jgi:hypothetical protein